MNKTVFLPISCLFVLFCTACSIPETEPEAKSPISESGVYAADISNSGDFAVISRVNSDISVWSIGENKTLFSWRHQEEGRNIVDNIHISADETHVVTADSDNFALWDSATGDPVGFWRIDESLIRDIAVSNNGRGILVGKANGKVMFFEPGTGRSLEFLGHEEKVNTVDISPNGKFALTGSNDYKAYLWSTETGQIIHVFNHANRVTKVAIDDQARYLFTSDSQADSQIWDAQTGKAISQLHFIERQWVFTSAKFSDDGKYLLTGSPAKRLALWDVTTGKVLQQWRVAPSNGPAPRSAVVYAVGFVDDDYVSISSSGNLEKWAF
ncbi:WD40 repeat domain-containing protein [Glaciecola sp.]|jgi:WD40 repeat protein|uniref:WD40 repeat domain-containing protein n=1 Tax=Glaciecola sp. MF2-115 TaxID=3384827 RepID=UPI003988AA14